MSRFGYAKIHLAGRLGCLVEVKDAYRRSRATLVRFPSPPFFRSPRRRTAERPRQGCGRVAPR